MTRHPGQDPDALFLLIHGYQISRILKAAADLGLADRIAPGTTAEVSDLATDLGVDADRLHRLFRALAAFGIFTADEHRRVGHTGRSLLMRTDSTPSLRDMARFWPIDGNWQTWAAFGEGLHPGRTAFEIAHGTSRVDYFNAHPEEAEIFNLAMAHKPDDPHAAVADAYDFSGAGLIVDVGGGVGMLLKHILTRHGGTRGITFDRAPTVEHARNNADFAALGERHRFESGDFLQNVPAGGDIYLLADILGSFSDDRCLTILRNCRAAIRDGGRLLVIDRVPAADPADGNPIDFLTDMHFMLIFPDGRLRSVEELGELLAAAGFGKPRSVPTASAVSIVEARAV